MTRLNSTFNDVNEAVKWGRPQSADVESCACQINQDRSSGHFNISSI